LVSHIHNRITKASLTTCLFVFTALNLTAQNVSKWKLDNPLVEAYNQSISLKLNSSRQLLRDYTGPSKYGKLYLEHLNDALEVFTSEEDLAYEGFIDNTDQRISELKDAENNPYRSYYLSEIKLHKTFIQLKFGEELSAAWNFKQAFNLAENNQEDYPDFELNAKTLGLMHIIIGSTPEKYKWLMSLFGFKGTLNEGIEELKKFSEENDVFSLESSVILAFVHSYLLQDSPTGFSILKKYEAKVNNHFLLAYALSSLYIKASQSEEALTVIDEFSRNNTNISFPFFDYQRGNIHQQKGEYQLSTTSFKEFLSHFEGHNYLKDGNYKMGLNYWLMGEEDKAEEFFELSEKIGQRVTEADKYASHMLKQSMSDRNITKLRLATDGGYFEKANFIVNEIKTDGLSTHKDSVEFIYRQARLKHKSGYIDQAIPLYLSTIDNSGKEHWYFAPNSALQLGYIYRSQGMIAESRKYLEKALSYKNHPYKNSIDNKAKAALTGLD
jgi:hypothetical protein